jgi:hypothetical protein
VGTVVPDAADGRVDGGLALFDAYTRRARIAPAVLAALPALTVLAAGALAPDRAARIAGILVGSVGLVIAGLVRDRGRALQPGLWTSWGGSPTLRRLRWRDADSREAVRRLHARLNPLLHEPLPDEQGEAADPLEADRRYGEAIAVLRERTRERARFPLVFAENAEYGFRRNALGLRPLGLAIAAVCLAMSCGFAAFGNAELAHRLTRWGISGLAAAALAVFWARVVTPEWVRRPAEVYADRLFEAVETLRRAEETRA